MFLNLIISPILLISEQHLFLFILHQLTHILLFNLLILNGLIVRVQFCIWRFKYFIFLISGAVIIFSIVIKFNWKISNAFLRLVSLLDVLCRLERLLLQILALVYIPFSADSRATFIIHLLRGQFFQYLGKLLNQTFVLLVVVTAVEVYFVSYFLKVLLGFSLIVQRKII